MNNLVYGVFKTIMTSMILIFVFDIASYLYLAYTFNNKMENLMVSMQAEVSANNGMTEEAHTLYVDLLLKLMDDMNGDAGDPNDDFIEGYRINYGCDAIGAIESITAYRNSAAVNIVVSDMKKVGDYGDIMVVQVCARLYQPFWRFEGGNSAEDFKRTRTKTELYYTYYVPCMKYGIKSA